MARYLCLVCLLGALGMAWGAEAAYRLSPQDIISVTVLRHTELSGQFTVPPDGAIDFPRAGHLVVVGKTAAEVTETLKAQYGTFLLNPEVTVAVVAMRVRHAFVLGAVAKPGQYPITAGMRVTELLAAAGDVVGERKELTARLVRGQTTIPLRLQEIFDGTDAANPPLQEGDLLWVETPMQITVVVSGQVKNPGAVKLRQGATLVDALAQAGDLSDRPERMKVSLLRAGVTEMVVWNDATKVLLDGDLIMAEREVLARVFINGHVRSPGAYDLPPGGGVLEVIALAGGVLENPALDQVSIQRCNGGACEKIDITPALRDGNVTANPTLRNGDLVIVPECSAKFAVLGFVGKPGTFPISPGKVITVTDAIGMAGGCLPGAKQSQIAVVRKVNGVPQRTVVDLKAIINQKKPEMNIVLQAGDIVYVPESSLQSLEKFIPLLGIFL